MSQRTNPLSPSPHRDLSDEAGTGWTDQQFWLLSSGITSVFGRKFQKVDANPRSNAVRALNSLNVPFFFGSSSILLFWDSKIAFPIGAGYSLFGLHLLADACWVFLSSYTSGGMTAWAQSPGSLAGCFPTGFEQWRLEGWKRGQGWYPHTPCALAEPKSPRDSLCLAAPLLGLLLSENQSNTNTISSHCCSRSRGGNNLPLQLGSECLNMPCCRL